METLYKDQIFFTEFAPLIQLWAGICLLFFYAGLLKDSPFASSLGQIKTLYQDFVSRYHDIINQEKMPQSDYYLGAQWSNLAATIKNLAALSFFYSFLILAFIGIEKNSAYSEMYIAFQIMNILVVLYFIVSALFVNVKIFHTYITPTLYFVLLLVYFHHYENIYEWLLTKGWFDGMYYSQTKITVYTLFSCILVPLFFVSIRLIYNYYILSVIKRRFKKIGRNFELMVDLSLGNISMKDLPGKLKKKLKNRIWKKIEENTNSENLTTAIIEEINEQFDKFTTTRKQRIKRKVKYRLKTIIESLINVLGPITITTLLPTFRFNIHINEKKTREEDNE